MKARIKLARLDSPNMNNRIYPEFVFAEAVENAKDKHIPIKLYGSERLPIGYADVESFDWPSCSFLATFPSPDNKLRELIKQSKVTFCGIGKCYYDDLKKQNVVQDMKLESLILCDGTSIHSEVEELESFHSCSSCKQVMEPFQYFVKYDDDIYCESCFFDLAVLKLGATSCQLDSQGNIIDDEIDEGDDD